MIRLRALSRADWRLWRELRLQALAEAPYAFSSKLSDWQGGGDTAERWQARLINVPLNLIAELHDHPAGMIGATMPDERGEVQLISLWVSPLARGRGVGDALVDGVVSWAQEQGASSVVLDVRDTNAQAIALYERHGFLSEGPTPTLPPQPPEQRMRLTLV